MTSIYKRLTIIIDRVKIARNALRKILHFTSYFTANILGVDLQQVNYRRGYSSRIDVNSDSEYAVAVLLAMIYELLFQHAFFCYKKQGKQLRILIFHLSFINSFLDSIIIWPINMKYTNRCRTSTSYVDQIFPRIFVQRSRIFCASAWSCSAALQNHSTAAELFSSTPSPR